MCKESGARYFVINLIYGVAKNNTIMLCKTIKL